MGTGCNDMQVYDRAISLAKDIFEYGSTLGYDMNLLDIGGGFPGCDYKKFIKVCISYLAILGTITYNTLPPPISHPF